MKKYRLKKSVLAVKVVKGMRRFVRVNEGAIYYDPDGVNKPNSEKVLLCKKWEQISKRKTNCYDCVRLPRNELLMYFDEIEIDT